MISLYDGVVVFKICTNAVSKKGFSLNNVRKCKFNYLCIKER